MNENKMLSKDEQEKMLDVFRDRWGHTESKLIELKKQHGIS